ncbi:hypothetical protein TPAU25S_00896 [Tsukamurella paurometabola]
MGIGSVILPLPVLDPGVRPRPAEWKTVRITSAVYGLGIVLVWLMSSSGSDVDFGLTTAGWCWWRH